MKILITNDDGIFAEGILTLAAWAKKLGSVTVVAPKTEQSGKSHGIDIHNPFEVKRADVLSGVRAFSVDSTPADCVRFATAGLGESFDLVLAGINRGFNVGEDIAYSGTCGAIFEAAYLGIPSVALSTDPASFASASAHLDTVYDYFLTHDLFAHNLLYNVNIPLDVKGIRLTRQGGAYYKDHFIHQGGDLYLADGYSVYRGTQDFTRDTDATLSGYLSITPLSVDRTAGAAYAELARLNES